MTTLSFIVVLKDRFQVNASNFDSSPVLIENLTNVGFIAVATLQVLAAGEKSVVLRQGSNSCNWYLLNASSSEGFVDTGTESNIVEEFLSVVSLVFAAKCFVFFVCQFEIQLTKNTAKLSLSDMSLA